MREDRLIPVLLPSPGQHEHPAPVTRGDEHHPHKGALDSRVMLIGGYLERPTYQPTFIQTFRPSIRRTSSVPAG
jgi:hypothetical protein